jgi:hypothetical protein
MRQTEAMKISAALGHDGQRFKAAEGVTLAHLCRAATVEQDGDFTAYRFDDGSSIIAGPGGWDLGFEGCDCFCWSGVGHADDCPERAA